MTQPSDTAITPNSSAKNTLATTAGHLPGEGAMWFFIIGDLIIFAVYFVFYTYYRGQNQELFLQSQQLLSPGIGFANTLILLTSSMFIALGAQAVHQNEAERAFRLMKLAFFVGALFPVFKLVEWVPKFQNGITPGKNLFFLYYYMMTGLHLCHVALGLVIQGFVLKHLSTTNKPDREFVDSGAVYWHMVDLLWILVFALFYLMR